MLIDLNPIYNYPLMDGLPPPSTFQGTALHVHLLFQLWTVSLCKHCKRKTNKYFADFIKIISWILKIFKNRILLEANFSKLSINLPWGHVRSHKKCWPDRFNSFDVYWIQTDRQTNKQTDRQAKFIYRLEIQGASRPSF